VEVIKKNTRFQYERSLAARYLSRGPRAIQITYRRDNAGGNDVAIFSGMKKWRQKSSCAVIFGNAGKKSLPQIAHLRCRKSRCIAIGILTLG
jgi:hypothetical protein